jgi:hypothetical protein
MARSKGGGLTNILLLLAIGAVLILTFILPFILVGGYFYNKVKLAQYNKCVFRGKSDFWLDQKEKAIFRSKAKDLSDIQREIDFLHQKGIDAGVSVNNDGRFSSRSTLGKQINAELAELLPERAKINEFLLDLQRLPDLRWQVFNKFYKGTKVFGWSVFVWLTVCAIEMPEFKDPQIWITTITTVIAFAVLWYSLNNAGEAITPRPEKVTVANLDDY